MLVKRNGPHLIIRLIRHRAPHKGALFLTTRVTLATARVTLVDARVTSLDIQIQIRYYLYEVKIREKKGWTLPRPNSP